MALPGGLGPAAGGRVAPREGAGSVEDVLAQVYREEWGRVVAALIHRTGDWDLAEECAQEAFAAALARWPRDGLPCRPGGWLMTVARNRAFDRLRRGATEAGKLREFALRTAGSSPGSAFATNEAVEEDSSVPDERLRLIFTCCHPALPMEARVALTLRTLVGLTTPEIARAFLVPEATMAKRLARAKAKIKNAKIPYRAPPTSALAPRVPGVLAVLYLLFNEGYSATTGAELIRRGLCDEAVRLCRAVAQLMPSEPEVKGLLALMLFQRSRQAARLDNVGDLVTLEEQDRSLWDSADIEQAQANLAEGQQTGEAGVYRLQAEIAGCHARARSSAATDWRAIAGLYTQLAAQVRSPVVELNRAVAVAMAQGPAEGLALVERLESSGELRGYYLLPATKADLLRRSGRLDEAAASYRRALVLVATEAERRFLAARLAEVTARRSV